MLRPASGARRLAARASGRLAPPLAALLAIACVSAAPERDPAPSRAAGGEAVGPVWQWVGTSAPGGGLEVDEPERYTLRLVPGGHARIRFDCNRGGGPYAIGEGRLVFGRLLSTRSACAPESLEARYRRQLDRVRAFRVEGEHLHLELAGDGGTMRFRRSPDDPAASP